MSTPGDRLDELQTRFMLLRSRLNLRGRLMGRDVADDLQPVSTVLAGQDPRITSTDGKVNPPGRRDETNGVFTGHSIGRRAPGPLSSLISSVMQPQPSEVDIESVRYAERQKVLNEVELEKVELKQREEDNRRKVREKPAVL